ncbi:uncharacterized protein LOC134687690 [Mytilus trossulus]|uniref:uncharacterized protein LOC134687690 n=1 Tax=Mytilus trossulus TaxID=6551 RepID=UPI0030042855
MENKKISQSSGENKMTTICQEEENYVRMSLLLSGISPRAVRVLFDREYAPSCLAASIKKETNKLKDLKQKRVINQSQWDLLFPRNGVPDSNMFDITLMIALLTNLTGLNHYDKLPLVTDTTPAADLGRMKYYRNLIAHNRDGKLDNSFFNTAWEDIIQAVGRLGGKNIFDECKELQIKVLEQSTVPWNIRVQISEVLAEWSMNNSNFVETRAANCILECAHKNSCVTITGSSGVGKTATLQYVALKMRDEGYNVLVITNLHDIVKFYNPKQKILFVIDDFCGTYSIIQNDVNILESDMNFLKVLIKNKLTKIVVACRLQVYLDDKFECLSIFKTCVCNLLSDEFRLSQTEKQSIAKLYLETKASKIIQYSDLHDFFPLLCKLYNDKPKPSITDFFENPYSVYKEEIDKLLKKGHLRKYCALALCVIFNNRLKEELFTDEVNIEVRTKIENTCQACKLNRYTSPLCLLDELNSLEYSFIKKDQDVYKTIHDKVFDFLTFYFGEKMIQCLIKNADSLIIGQRFSLYKQDNTKQFITVVPTKCHQMYIDRMIDDWSNGFVQCVFDNINIKIPEFRQRFLCYLKTFEISRQRQLALSCDVNSKCNALLCCCRICDINLIQWCIYHGADVNQSKCCGLSPLNVASLRGAVEVVKLLLVNMADIDKPSENGASPLFHACLQNHIEVVQVLLDNKAKINKCTDKRASPLYIACLCDHMEIVKVLLDNKADINTCVDNGISPLIEASVKNHISIAKLLLEYKADINKCTDHEADINKCRYDGESPLFIACLKNHTEIVKVLLDYKADINNCTHDGVSPLYIACQDNHIEVVKVLLNYNADVNKCRDNGASPLCIACEGNHIDILELLLDNKADINKCVDNGSFALFIASWKNYVDIVQILLNNNADINKCTNDGLSSLFIACENNHIEVVKVLLENKADVDSGLDIGATPLNIACMKNHIEIVKLLLDNKADINGDKGDSPLCIACCKNYIDIVHTLLVYKADINKCADDGTSPLFIACQHNHIEVVKMLLENNADIDKCTYREATPLYIACCCNHIEVVKLLLHNKADVNKCTEDGVSPLYIASQNKHIETVKVLLDNKADILISKEIQPSPLHTSMI